MQLLCERLVKVEQVAPVIYEGGDYSLLLDSAVANDRIVDADASKVVVLCVIRCNECIGDVWDIIAGI